MGLAGLENMGFYVVTALDAAGNESGPSAARYLNFALLPVADLAITLGENAFPALVWEHAGATIDGYDVYRGDPIIGTTFDFRDSTSMQKPGYTTTTSATMTRARGGI